VDPVILILLFAIAAFYFILLRPVLNQQRARRNSISSLEVGDEVMTTGGFYAVVDEINTVEDGPMEIIFELADDVFVRGTPDAIVQVIGHEQVDDDEPDSAMPDSGLDAEPAGGDDGGDDGHERSDD
jgi:preprotein translocase subunit YajC